MLLFVLLQTLLIAYQFLCVANLCEYNISVLQ